MSREKEDRPKILFSPLSSMKSESLGVKSWNGSVNGRQSRYTNCEPGLRNAEIRQAAKRFLMKAWLRRFRPYPTPRRNSFKAKTYRVHSVWLARVTYALHKACFIRFSPWLSIHHFLTAHMNQPLWWKPCISPLISAGFIATRNKEFLRRCTLDRNRRFLVRSCYSSKLLSRMM